MYKGTTATQLMVILLININLALAVWDELSLLKIFKYWSKTTAFGEQGRGLFAWHAAGQKTANLGGPEIHHRVFRQNTTWKLNQSSIWKIQQVSYLNSNIRLTLLTWFALTSWSRASCTGGDWTHICLRWIRQILSAESIYQENRDPHLCWHNVNNQHDLLHPVFSCVSGEFL